jgi:hypothetical protein
MFTEILLVAQTNENNLSVHQEEGRLIHTDTFYIATQKLMVYLYILT